MESPKIPSNVIGNQVDPENRAAAATNELLQILCSEIVLDGGASFVTSLKDYLSVTMSSKRLNALLVRAIGKAKLLTFLETFPDIFQVDRNATPHWVILLKQNQLRCRTFAASAGQDKIDDNIDQIKKKEVQEKLQSLVEKALYILRKRQSKLERRRQRLFNDGDANRNGNDDNDYETAEEEKVNSRWLLRQCKWDLHFYLRAAGVYQALYERAEDVYPVGTQPWQELILSEFEFVLSKNSGISIEKSKVWLCPSSHESGVSLSSPSLTYSSGKQAKEILEERHQYLQRLDETLTQLVERDGATQVYLHLLLHRHSVLKNLLGGRDLWQLIKEQQANDKGLFKSIDIFQEGPDIVLKSKKDSCGRMKVDDVGLYSVTNAKWGNAVANIMVHCVKQLEWENGASNNDSAYVTAIDLTASVGGMTLGLAKTGFFKKVIAIEIDPGRADLCRQNMSIHGMQDLVEVHTMDAMDAISSFRCSRTCIVIDPPWGGINYKRNMNDSYALKMGAWSLEAIVQKIAFHAKPCVVGLRLPVNFSVNRFLDSLRKDWNLAFDTLSIRKLSVQLFVVVAFQEHDESNSIRPSSNAAGGSF